MPLLTLVAGNALLGGLALLILIKPFMGASLPTPKKPHEGPFGMLLGPVILALGGIAAGVMVGWLNLAIIGPTVAAITGHGAEPHMGWAIDLTSMAFLLSVATWVLAGVVFWRADMLRSLLRSENVHTAIIFCNRKTTVRELNKSLQKHGFRSGEIHGDIDQASRQRQLDAFKNGTINLLVASDVAARGLDIKGVSHVFNFDAPWHPDDYVHRIGRTGRAGAKGKAFTFVTKADEEAIDNIEKLIGLKIERLGKPATESADEPERERSTRRKARTEPQKAGDAKAPPRSAKPESSKRAKPVRKERADETSDCDWNGPMPDFLSVAIPL